MAYTMEHLLSVLHPSCPAEADVLCKTRRRVEHGLTTVGLKIHCLGDNWELLNLIRALGGRSEVIGTRVYAHACASVTVILPPVGSACLAIMLLECIEKYFGHPIFHNPRYQIQVCSPCRLDGRHAAILAIAFYLGSDVLRRYSLDEIQQLPFVAKTVDLEPHSRKPVFDAPAILAERINFDRAVRVQNTEQILHGIGHGSSPLRAIAEPWTARWRVDARAAP